MDANLQDEIQMKNVNDGLEFLLDSEDRLLYFNKSQNLLYI